MHTYSGMPYRLSKSECERFLTHTITWKEEAIEGCENGTVGNHSPKCTATEWYEQCATLM